MEDIIKVHEINGYITSIYLLEKNSELALLDSGCRCDVKVVEDYILNELKLSMKNLKVVIATHAHPDHSGGASYYQRKWGVKVCAPEDLNNWYSGLNGFFTYVIDIFLTLYVARKMKRPIKNILFSRNVKIDHPLKHNDLVPGFNNLQVVKAPGHTTCDISIYCTDRKLIYVADNIISLRSKYIRPYPLFSPNDYKKTLEKYKELEISKYLLAHSGVREISNDVLDELCGSISDNPRVHRTALFGILLKSFKKTNR